MKKQYHKQEIADLLEKFMAGETSLEEEHVLAQYFRTHEVSDEWAEYKEMFALFDSGAVDVEPRSTLTGKPKTIPLRWLITGIAASILLLIGFSLLMKEGAAVEEQPVVAEVIEPEVVEPEVVEQPAPEPVEVSESSEIPEPIKPNKPIKPIEPIKPQLATASVASATDSTPRLTTTADSLYYYLTQLENQMGECRDSTCLAELGNLIRADERIKGLVNKIIHKEVETAFQEEYLVDTTTHYIPL